MDYLLNKIFTSAHFLDGLTHWLIQRSTALMIVLSLVLVPLVDDFILFVLFYFFVIFHVFAGIQTLINDYIHDHVLFLISLTSLRLCILFLFKTVYVIFLC